ncbi:hypothetical protein OUZ56_007629 [Daphnia magna]|uniref:Uncharacterized protein n=1 Tax=Daphnia magna TaxID=35525 RepID=A0ABR0AAQ9_9CRUS|nr:hypothetical protein OUZ56_007629 [Daphnia magna]
MKEKLLCVTLRVLLIFIPSFGGISSCRNIDPAWWGTSDECSRSRTSRPDRIDSLNGQSRISDPKTLNSSPSSVILGWATCIATISFGTWQLAQYNQYLCNIDEESGWWSVVFPS